MSSLPVIQERQRIRPSRTSKWRAGVLITIHLLIALHITHWLVTGRSVTPVEPSEAMAFSRDGIVNAGLIFFCVAILLTLFFGRLFCGWACHLVALQDLSRWLLAKAGIRPRPLGSRILRWVPFLACGYMFLWPAVYRLWIGDSFRSIHVEMTTGSFWATFPGWIIGALTFLICGFVIVYLLGAKSFCTYACPYGAVFGVVDRFARLRVRVTDACRGCGHCTAVCTSNVPVHAEVRDFGMVVNDGCMKCLDCVSVCPNDALYYGMGPSRGRAIAGSTSPQRRRPTLTWGDEAVLAMGFAAAFFTFRGLYGVVPFLMALGLSAVLAYLMLVATHSLIRPHLSLRQFRLKHQGRLLPAGYLFLTLMVLLTAFWIHSGIHRYHHHLGERHFRATAGLRLAALDIASQPSALNDRDSRRLRAGIHHLEKIQSQGLFSTLGNTPRLAWLYFLSGSPVEFSSAAERAIELGEYTADMHHLLALEAVRERDLEGALPHFNTAIEADPYRPEPRGNLGLVLVSLNRFPAAEAVFDEALEYVEGSPDLHYNSGLIKAIQGDSPAAIARFEETLALSPTHLAARENLAGVLASIGRFRESAMHYRVAVEQSPNDAETRLLLARVLLGLGDHEGALAELDRCLDLDPGHREAIILHGTFEAEHGQ